MKINKLFVAQSIVIWSFLTPSQAQTDFPFEKQTSIEATSVKNQGNTGTCWSFSATSFIESEMVKQGKKAIDLSEMYWVRNIYMEKGIRYVRYHGLYNFSQGSLAHDLIYAYKKYGAVPESVYSGKKEDGKYNHTDMEIELKSYLDTLISKGNIDANWKVGFEAILDKHMGAVPPVFNLDDGVYNPLTFAEKKVGINPDDYVSITSFEHHPVYQPFVLEVPDNWSGGSFYNVNLPEMMQVLYSALQNGYTVEWDGDVSEPGFRTDLGIAMFVAKKEDITSLKKLPKEKIVTITTRQAGFDNYETTDDHLMHVTGIYNDPDGNAFYQVKNSWGEKAGANGYIYMSDLYFQMKTVSIMVNKKAIPTDLKMKLYIN